MYKYLIMKLFTFLLLSTFLLSSCSDEENLPTIEVSPSAFRLKHLTTTSQVGNALGNFTAGWQLSDIELTNIGPYPKFPYIYYYNIFMRKGAGPSQEIISFRIQAGGPVNSDVTLETYLAEHPNMIPIHDDRLRNYTGVYLVKDKDNNHEKWSIELYTPHIAKDGNHTMHSVVMYCYGTTPPPPDDIAVTALLGLLEENKE